MGTGVLSTLQGNQAVTIILSMTYVVKYLEPSWLEVITTPSPVEFLQDLLSRQLSICSSVRPRSHL